MAEPASPTAPIPAPPSPQRSPSLSPDSPSSPLPPGPEPSSAPLPIMAFRERIVQKIKENQVTLIVGETGCGKSSQVPQFLLEEKMEPILCTQPRRFAVVAIAQTVALARKCEVGGEIGYHIGHSNVSSSSSRITFKTAGVLLEQMRDKGLAALKYKVIILDEVHERSVESDLVLACIKQFMTRNSDLRVVLMSATADITRYKDYFRDLRKGEGVEVLAIPSASRRATFQRKVIYLEQVSELVGINLESLVVKHRKGFNPSTVDAEMNPEVHKAIHTLIIHIHEKEPDIQKSILVFLPTYNSLEQQWVLLRPHLSLFKVHILHRSIDTEQALASMKISKSHRKVILATNIAESSVTIPGVAFVIDSCRNLQVFWDPNRRIDATELVWVSKSQAEQRKGRTGRTCDGEIYRLVSGAFFNSLNDHEYPAISRLSLRKQVLTVCCAESKSINDPKVLLQKVMDPPNPAIIEEALDLLVQIKALKKFHSHRGRYEPTFYGRLLDSLPLSFESSVLLLKFGDMGLLHEGILISVLMDIQPLPIVQPFAQQELFTKYIDNYFEDIKGLGKREVVFMANLCAYHFWQRTFKDKYRLERLMQILDVDESKYLPSMITNLEDNWCNMHNLVPRALRNVSEIYEEVLHSIHCFRPKFLQLENHIPSYYEPYEFKHSCILHSETVADTEIVSYEEAKKWRCLALPYVSSEDFEVRTIAEMLADVIKEIRVQYAEDNLHNQGGILALDNIQPELCRFFLYGGCYKGDDCFFSHSLHAKRPQCKFHFTLQGCRNGELCMFSHEHHSRRSLSGVGDVCPPEDEVVSSDSFLQILHAKSNGHVVILNDKNLYFTSAIVEYFDSSRITVIQHHLESTDNGIPPDNSNRFQLFDVDEPWSSIIEPNGKVLIPWPKVHCVLWFGDLVVNEEETEHQRLRNFLECLSLRILAEGLADARLIIIMNNVRFSQLQVERLARECFFFLCTSFPFDVITFGGPAWSSGTGRRQQTSLAVCYVFDLHSPSTSLFGDYSAVLRKGLSSRQQ